jgi:hypothetical protein
MQIMNAETAAALRCLVTGICPSLVIWVEQYLPPFKPGFYVKPAANEFCAAGEQIAAAAIARA